jgi:hypothetical protein
MAALTIAAVGAATGCSASGGPGAPTAAGQPQIPRTGQPATAQQTSTARSPLPGAPEVPDTGDASGELGDTLTVDGVAVTVHNLRYDPCLGEGLDQAPPGHTFVVLDATVTNRGYTMGQPNYEGPAWTLDYLDPNDDADEPSEHTAINKGTTFNCHEFPSADSVATGDYLTAGATVRTSMVFDVPVDAYQLTAVYEGGTGSIAFFRLPR